MLRKQTAPEAPGFVVVGGGGTLSRTEHKPRLGYNVKMKLNLSVMSKVENAFFVLVMKPLILGIF